MASDDFLLTAEELRMRQRRRRRVSITIALVVVVLVTAASSGRFVFGQIKAWQARRHADKAFALIAQQKWLDARNEASAAYQLRPNEPQAIRAIARFLSRTQQSQALDFWEQLEKMQPLTRDDRQDEAAAALASHNLERAEKAVRALLDSGANAAAWLLEAQLATQKSDAAEANAALDKVFNDAQATPRQQFQAALLERSLGLSSEGGAERVVDAWRRLESLSRGTDDVSLDALVLLAQQLISQPADAPHPFALTTEEIRRGLESHPLSKAAHKLLAIDLQIYLDIRAGQPDAHKAQLIDRAIEQFRNGDNTDLLALAVWLNGKGEYQRELDTIPLEKALQTRELFLQRTDALGALGRWSDIKELLESEKFPLDPVMQRMYLARCNAQLGEKTAAENNWKRALEAAGDDSGKLLSLGDYAEKNGNVDIAESAYANATAIAPQSRPAWQGRLRIAQAKGDTKKMHDVLAKMLELTPDDPAVQNDEAYTRLLLLQQSREKTEDGGRRTVSSVEAGVSPARSETKSEIRNPNSETLNTQLSTLNSIEQLARQLVGRNPRSLPHRTLLALALLTENRPNDALHVYDNIQVTANALTPSALAVHAAVLAANGKTEDAKTEIVKLPRNQLLPEERALIADL